MNLRLELSIANTILTSHEGLKVEVRVFNQGAETLPEAPLLTDALGIEFFTPAGRLKLRMDGTTREEMLGPLGQDPSLTKWGPLCPGDHWTWRLDLASYHYGIPAGSYDVEAVFRPEPGSPDLRSDRTFIYVSEPHLLMLDAQQDREGQGRLILLMHARKEEEDVYYLRALHLHRPQAALYSEQVLAGEEAADVFLSHPAFIQADEVGPPFKRWILWRRGGEVRARLHHMGKRSGGRRRATLPPGRRLLHSAWHTAGNGLFVVMLGPERTLECHALEEGGLREVFVHRLPCALEMEPSVGADQETIHLAIAQQGVIHQRLDHGGRALETRRLIRSRLPAFSCLYDRLDEAIKVLFWARPKTVKMAVVDVNRDHKVCKRVLERIPLHGELLELSFDMDSRGRFHLGVSTRQGMYHLRDGRPPRRIYKGEGRFFPHVITGERVYLGFYRQRRGYRFFPVDQVQPL